MLQKALTALTAVQFWSLHLQDLRPSQRLLHAHLSVKVAILITVDSRWMSYIKFIVFMKEEIIHGDQRCGFFCIRQ